ncbi:putative SP-containing protein [Vairimorpha necatrix]|uniref:SP-containing protein n=1 Tax=Vairimorpha necatrix TaxID=6039 RepID=A0AAX4JFC0_9MICR
MLNMGFLLCIIGVLQVTAHPHPIKKDLSTTEREYTVSKSLKKCTRELYQESDDIKTQDDDLFEQRSTAISEIIYDSFMDKMLFPIRIKVDWVTKDNKKEDVIRKKDLSFLLFGLAIEELVFNREYKGKEKAVRGLLSSLAEQTRPLYKALSCINYKVNKFNIKKLQEIITDQMDIKMDVETSYKVKQVFETKSYKKIISFIEYNKKNETKLLGVDNFSDVLTNSDNSSVNLFSIPLSDSFVSSVPLNLN